MDCKLSRGPPMQIPVQNDSPRLHDSSLTHRLTHGCRRLLAMVCIVREEVQFVARELRQAQGDFSAALKATRNMLPQGAMAFLQRLMQVADPLQR